MTITVQVEGGPTLEFPDGTTYDVIQKASKKYSQTPSDMLGYGTGLARQAALGVPIAGAAVNPLEAATSAAIETGPSAAAHGILYRRGLPPNAAARQRPVPPSIGTEMDEYFRHYAEDLEKERQKDAAFQAENPKASMAAQLAGGVASTLPLAATTTGARVLGLGGSVPSQMLRGGASSAGISAADAAARGNDPLQAGTIGGAVGAAVPLVGSAVSALARPITDRVRALVNPAGLAQERVRGAIQRGQALPDPRRLTPAEMTAAQAEGHPVANMDIGGEPGLALARSAANISPEARQTLQNTIDQRFQSQNQRMSDWLNSRLNYPTEQARNDAIRDVRENVYQPRYAQAYRDSAQVPLWPDATLMRGRSAAEQAALQNLEELAQAPEVQSAIRAAVPQLRNWAVRDGLRPPENPFLFEVGPNGVPRTTLKPGTSTSQPFPSLQLWDYVKRALDGMNTPTSGQFARGLRENLDVLVPSYRAAREAAQPTRFFNGATNAHEAGQNFINQGQNFGPDAVAQLARMTPAERALFQDGYMQQVISAIERRPDRFDVINRINNSPAARTEVERALGPGRFNELAARLHVEDIMNRARDVVKGNSTTARQLAEMGLSSAAGGIGADYLTSGHLSPTAVLYGALLMGSRYGVRRLDERVAQRVATLMTSNNHQQLNLGMQMAARNPTIMSALRYAAQTAGAQQTQRPQQ